ncbi:hypothetical protein [Endozoicomonas ascidiicola]|uniref:hypothetical protein n=1 Tax=Endozoicomonas ascidiicola TaxID=1698521 RepID=UPI000829B6AD|nr:hypothetical protein [Endozoicomonas ascidiicola]
MKIIGKIKPTIWHDNMLRKVSQNGRYLALYLLSCPHGNSLGVFLLPYDYALADLQWNSNALAAAMDELKGAGFLDYSRDHTWISILNFQQIDPAANGKQLTGRIRLLEKLPPLGLSIEGAIRHLKLQVHPYFTNQKGYIDRIDTAYIRYTGENHREEIAQLTGHD